VSHSKIKTIFFRGFINSIIFSFIWGGWAYYVNRFAGDVAAVNAAITQISFTIVNAFFYSVFMEFMFSLSNKFIFRFINAWIVPNTLLTVLIIGVHYIRGTNELFITVSAPLAVIFCVSAWYVFKEQKKDNLLLERA